MKQMTKDLLGVALNLDDTLVIGASVLLFILVINFAIKIFVRRIKHWNRSCVVSSFSQWKRVPECERVQEVDKVAAKLQPNTK